MRFTSEQRLDDGVLEREFVIGESPGLCGGGLRRGHDRAPGER